MLIHELRGYIFRSASLYLKELPNKKTSALTLVFNQAKKIINK